MELLGGGTFIPSLPPILLPFIHSTKATSILNNKNKNECFNLMLERKLCRSVSNAIDTYAR